MTSRMMRHRQKLESFTGNDVTILPDAVEDIAVWKYSDVDIGDEDVVEPALLLVPEERVRHPDLLRVRHREVLDLG